jgi:GAF domain-containing protein
MDSHALLNGRRTESTADVRSDDSLTQQQLDRVTHLAGEMLDAPVACAWLVDAERQLLMSSSGLSAPIAMLLSYPFCKQMIASGQPLTIADGREDPSMARSPAVRDGSVGAFAGTPLVASYGRALGTLFVMDPKPRAWTAPQLDLLVELSALIVSDVELGAVAHRASQSDVGHREIR